MNFADWIGLVGGGLGILGIVGYLGTWLFQESIKARLDIQKQREIDNFKHKIEQEMAGFQHRLELDQAKLSIVFESQKASFAAVLRALAKAKAAVSDSYDIDEGYEGISYKEVTAFRDAVHPESLFIPTDCDWGLSVFGREMSRTVYSPPDFEPTGTEIERAFDAMTFIAGKLKECFRREVGLSVDGDPMLDLHVYLAVRLVNTYGWRDEDRIKDILKQRPEQSPEELVSIGKENIDVLRNELHALKTYVENNKHLASSMYETRLTAERYLDRLKNATAQEQKKEPTLPSGPDLKSVVE